MCCSFKLLSEEKIRVLSLLNYIFFTWPISPQHWSWSRRKPDILSGWKDYSRAWHSRYEQFYLKNPDNNYVSRFPERFCGCIGCGSLDHAFRSCPHKASPKMRQQLFQDILTHVPSTRKPIKNSPVPKVSFTTLAVISTYNINILYTHTHLHTSNVN